jgi:peroxiredoxin
MVRIHAGQPTSASMNYNAPPPPPVPARAGTGLAIASLALGVIACLLSLFVIGLVFGAVGLVLGLVHVLRRRGPAAMAWWGMSLSLVAIFISVGLGFLYLKGIREFKKVVASITSSATNNVAGDWEGVLAPDFSVTTLDGKTIKLSDYKGKRVVLDFWASWWPPCVAEIPDLIKLQNDTSRDELVIIGVSQEDAGTLEAFAKKKGINYLVASATNLPAPFKDFETIPTTFFIDRKGVIQTVSVGGGGFDKLKDGAAAGDFKGEPRPEPGPPPSGLKESEKSLTPTEVWSKSIPGGQALCLGDWDDDGQADILVASGASTGNSKLHVFGLGGVEKTNVSLPAAFTMIECGTNKLKGLRLLGYSNWQKVLVMDRAGKQIWNYSSGMGIDGAHWGDLDGDGTDEMVVGMNGFGGLHAVSADGKQLWRATLGNVWAQAIVPASGERAGYVLATEAGGSVRVFDTKGNAVRSFRLAGGFCTQMTAAAMDAKTIQGIALGQGTVIAFDIHGTTLWSTPSSKNPSAWTQKFFTCGDIDGDGVKEWAFPDAAGDLVLVTVHGEKLASLSGAGTAQSFVIVPGTEGGRLVTLTSGQLKCYSFGPEQKALNR